MLGRHRREMEVHTMLSRSFRRHRRVAKERERFVGTCFASGKVVKLSSEHSGKPPPPAAAKVIRARFNSEFGERRGVPCSGIHICNPNCLPHSPQLTAHRSRLNSWHSRVASRVSVRTCSHGHWRIQIASSGPNSSSTVISILPFHFWLSEIPLSFGPPMELPSALRPHLPFP
jgi:hypothetical protein